MKEITNLKEYKKEKLHREDNELAELEKELDSIDGEDLFGFLLGHEENTGVDNTLKNKFLEKNADGYMDTIQKALEHSKQVEEKYKKK